ncbi:unnamed protein product [Zymoseptoria tritici ST99CH_1E4]|uniref:Uncharacterized protein n=1 Tax=Zymoseptoria tritici ST99CH_1E4 TaxID=1276532 RepID=A0A2H1H401_ZYMTR|nr:unnamed protein product [Zymoseptoria tritici ST99CH_1E4]
MVANATAMKLAALSTVNNRLQLDDHASSAAHARKKAKTSSQPTTSRCSPTASDRRSSSPSFSAQLPGIAITGPPGSQPNMGMHIPQSNGYLAAYDGNMAALNNGLQAMSMAQYGVGGGFGNDMYLSDGGMHERGRLVALDEAGLEAKGVAAKGARTKLLKVFEQVREAQADGRL